MRCEKFCVNIFWNSPNVTTVYKYAGGKLSFPPPVAADLPVYASY